jgi:hypothetical protein
MFKNISPRRFRELLGQHLHYQFWYLCGSWTSSLSKIGPARTTPATSSQPRSRCWATWVRRLRVGFGSCARGYVKLVCRARSSPRPHLRELELRRVAV